MSLYNSKSTSCHMIHIHPNSNYMFEYWQTVFNLLFWCVFTVCIEPIKLLYISSSLITVNRGSSFTEAAILFVCLRLQRRRSVYRGGRDLHDLHLHIRHDQLRARRALSIFKYVPLRTRRALLLYKVYGDSALLVLKGTSLNNDSALLALNWRYNFIIQTNVQSVQINSFFPLVGVAVAMGMAMIIMKHFWIDINKL